MKPTKKSIRSFANKAIRNTKPITGGQGGYFPKHPGNSTGNDHPRHPGYDKDK